MKKDSYEQSIIDLIFADFGPRPMAKVSVTRVEPEWCAGYLGTFDVEDPHELPSEKIHSRYGGAKFYVKIRDGYGRFRQHRTIRICDVPRQDGLPISPEDVIEAVSDTQTGPTEDIETLREMVDTLSAKVDALTRE